jgi:RNA polymerase sigma-70 factor (ECF subfamily)
VERDAQLIEATLSGDSAAFGQLVVRYQDRLYATAFRMMGSDSDARDVVQDAMVQAFVKLDTFRGTCAFYSWLYRIAVNMAISRKRRRRPTISVEESRTRSSLEPASRDPSPDGRLLQQEKVDQVQAALDAMSDEHRAVLVLREIEGCPYETIAEILELPVGTIRSRLHRARLQLKEQLQEVLEGELEE